MSCGVIFTVQGSADEYDAVHRAVVARTGGEVAGLVLHVARLVEGGYQVIEVWDSQEACDEANRTVVRPAVQEALEALGRDQRPDAAASPPQVEGFEVRGLIVAGPRTAV